VYAAFIPKDPTVATLYEQKVERLYRLRSAFPLEKGVPFTRDLARLYGQRSIRRRERSRRTGRQSPSSLIAKFTAGFDEVFRSDGIRTIRTPVRAPRANAFIERWIGTVRRECLDRILIVNRRHLERVLPVYIRHYNEHRPHRSLHQRPPIEEPPPGSDTVVVVDHVRRRDVLGGLIHEYKIAA
jgi:putative transposase